MKSSPVPVAGVDVSKEFSDMCILSPDNDVFERVKVYHDKTSMSQRPQPANAFKHQPPHQQLGLGSSRGERLNS